MPAATFTVETAAPADGSTRARTGRLALTHGIYGAGSNWRAIARKVSQQRPDWTVVLVDLRNHGRSEGGNPPHTLRACAEGLRRRDDE